MPRPNRPRSVQAEAHLARRILLEREGRGWTYDGLAERMTKSGCPVDPSAIYKIEKGKPPRRIVVDELVAFAQVFGVPVEDLLLPPELAAQKQLTELVIDWTAAGYEIDTATTKQNETWAAIQDYVAAHPEARSALESVFGKWAELHFDEDDREGAAAYKMWQLTRDEKWIDIVRKDLDRG